jgi:membrane-bound metal-dependent hydrolase YbcI (DUF457 family)
MSWAAHDLEPYAIQRHFGRRIAIIPLLIGSYAPDMSTKWFVYGINVFGFELKADDPATFHRGWPGVGFTHSLLFGVAVAAIILLAGRALGRPSAKIWAFSFLIGQWSHALTDMGDTVGTMLFFPFTTKQFALGAWAYAGQTGRFTDAGAYFSGLGFVWDGVWVAYGAINWRVLTREYFRQTVLPVDPVWGWGARILPEVALLALYRASFFYGTTRWIAWLFWAHVRHSFDFDLSWGGPDWVPALAVAPLRFLTTCSCASCRCSGFG